MDKGFRYFVFILIIASTCFFLYPTFKWYSLDQDTKNIVSGSKIEVRDYITEQAQKDLDRLVELAESDDTSVVSKEYNYLIDEVKKNLIDSKPSASELLQAFGSKGKDIILLSIKEQYRDKILKIKDIKRNIIQLGLDIVGGVSIVLEADVDSLNSILERDATQQEINDAIDIALEVLNNRIDEFGVSEPQIRRLEGENRILIEIPGDNDPDRINSFLRGAGSLKLQIVDDEATSKINQEKDYNLEDDNPDYITEILKVKEYKKKDDYGIDKFVSYVVTDENVENIFDGKNIKEVEVVSNNLGQPQVTFVLNNEGAKEFAILTRNNINKSMAIVLDDIVKAYAVIRSEINGGRVSIEGFSAEEARDVATVLKTASLPIKLYVINQNIVGSFISRDIIKKALQAIIFGFLSVMIFMLFKYRSIGLIANISLIFNIILLMGILSAFNLTLTLTGIAGIILNIGMSVDANVIIFERIKEERRDGSSIKEAIKKGYQRAFLTIMDSNITTLIAAMFLSYLATGAIQGFSVTLATGIITSMFSSIFISRLLLDTVIDFQKEPKLNIGE